MDMKATISKAIFKSLKALPHNRLLPDYDFASDFHVATGVDINDHLKDYETVTDELQRKLYLRVEKRMQGNGDNLIKGLNFDEWENEISQSQRSQQQINISSINSDNIQIGNNNTQNINASAEEVVAALQNLMNKPEDERKTIFDELNQYLKGGVTTLELVKRLVQILL